jgi:hypothetical protein
MNVPETAEAETKGKAPPPKKGQEAAVVEEEDPITCHSEKDLIVDGLYSDVREKLRSVNDIERLAPESLFVLQRSSMNIFRFEDVIFSVYPHMAAHRRRGTSLKEAFSSIDPNAKKLGAGIGSQN